MRNSFKISLVAFFVFIFVMSFTNQSKAIPAFARKHGGCSMCHTTIPKLNQFGYEFRANGFKTAEELTNDDTEVNLANMYSGRIKSRFVQKNKDDAGAKSNSNTLELHEISLYPISGSFNKNISSFIEMSYAPDEAAEIENAYVRYNLNNYFVKFGVMHAWEGYGASDRPISLSKPLYQTEAVNNFAPWLDQAGVTFGITQKNTSANLTIFNGLTEAGDPAQGGGLTKAATAKNKDAKDYQVFINQFFGTGGAAASLYYYKGKLDLGGNENSFNRWALFANYPISRFNILAAYEQGKDSVATVGDTKSGGYFGEVDANLLTAEEPGGLNVTGVLRYEVFDPNKDVDNNKITATTAALNMPLNNGLQFILEYQQKKTEKTATTNKKEDKLQLEAIWIF